MVCLTWNMCPYTAAGTGGPTGCSAWGPLLLCEVGHGQGMEEGRTAEVSWCKCRGTNEAARPLGGY